MRSSLLSPTSPGTESNSSATPQPRPREAFTNALQLLQRPETFGQRTSPVPEGFESFKAALVACEVQAYGAPSKLDVYAASIMKTLGVSNIKELREVEEGQEAACNIPVLPTNRLKAIIAAQKTFL